MGKALIGLIILGIGLTFYSLQPKKPELTKDFTVSVEVVDEKNKIFESVFNQKKTFEYDEKTKKYKLCIGETSPTTYKTACETQLNSIQVLYFSDKNQTENKPFYLCLYVNLDGHGCRIGNPESEFYSLEEITK